MIETIFRILDRNGKVVDEVSDIKLAKIIDHRTDVLYAIVEKLEAEGIEETIAEKVAERFIEDRSELISLLKGVKEIPSNTDG